LLQRSLFHYSWQGGRGEESEDLAFYGLEIVNYLAVKELANKGISIMINDLVCGMSEFRRVTPFFGDLDGTLPQWVRTFSRDNETVETICTESGLKTCTEKWIIAEGNREPALLLTLWSFHPVTF